VARSTQTSGQISGAFAFRLYDEQGFPLDLTELMARERGLTVDTAGFEKLMDEQRARAPRRAEKGSHFALANRNHTPTKFVGYENLAVQAKVLEVVSLKNKTAVILDASACYAEMAARSATPGNWNMAASFGASPTHRSPATRGCISSKMRPWHRPPACVPQTQTRGLCHLFRQRRHAIG